MRASGHIYPRTKEGNVAYVALLREELKWGQLARAQRFYLYRLQEIIRSLQGWLHFQVLNPGPTVILFVRHELHKRLNNASGVIEM